MKPDRTEPVRANRFSAIPTRLFGTRRNPARTKSSARPPVVTAAQSQRLICGSAKTRVVANMVVPFVACCACGGGAGAGAGDSCEIAASTRDQRSGFGAFNRAGLGRRQGLALGH